MLRVASAKIPLHQLQALKLISAKENKNRSDLIRDAIVEYLGLNEPRVPIITDGPLIIVTFKLPEDLIQQLDTYAQDKKVSRSEVIRAALEKIIVQRAIRHASNKL